MFTGVTERMSGPIMKTRQERTQNFSTTIHQAIEYILSSLLHPPEIEGFHFTAYREDENWKKNKKDFHFPIFAAVPNLLHL